MIWLSIAIFALQFIGIASIFIDIDIKTVFGKLIGKELKYTLRDELLILRGETPKSFFGREGYEIEQIMKATGREMKFESLKKFAVIGFAVGVITALILGNMFLIPVFGAAFAYIPVLFIRSTAISYNRRMNDELEGALSIVTTSYLRTGDIRRSVRENIAYLHAPVKAHFENFLMETEYVSPNIVGALNRMKLKIPHAIFHEWINTIIRCQSDRTIRHSLAGVLEKFQDVRTVQAEINAASAAAKREVIVMILLVIGQIPLLYLINKDWYMSLIGTLQGKAVLAITAAIAFISYIRVQRLAEPVMYGGAE